MSRRLKHRIINGLFWKFGQSVGQQGLQFVIQIILARLLLPKHFGLIGMITIFIAISQTIMNSGLGLSLIQKRDTNQKDFSTVFLYNLFLSTILVGAFYLTAPLISSFYNEKELASLIRFLSLVLILNAFTLTQNAMLQKELRFKDLARINIMSILLSGTISIFMAYNGYGVWSLATQVLLNSLFRALFLWLNNKWLPTHGFSRQSFKSLFPYGSRLLLASLLNTAYQNIYLVIIGKVFNATSLGFYSQARKFEEIPTINLANIVESVTFPAFSIIQDDDNRLRKGYKQSLKMLSFINLPFMMFLIAEAEHIFALVLTEKWLPSVPYFRLFCIIGMIYPISNLNLNILRVKGRADILLNLTVVKLTLSVITIAITVQFGILVLVIGQVLLTTIAYFLNSFFAGRFIDYGTRKQIIDMLPYIFVTAVLGIVVFPIGQILSFPNIIYLPFMILITVSIYVLLNILFKIDTLYESIKLAKSHIFAFHSQQ